MNGGQYEERKKQKQAKENKKQAPMDCDCCYRNSCGNFCSMRGRNVGKKGKCLEDTSSSVIGKTGLEGLFEKELKGENGCRIYITDSEGREKKELARITVQNGKDIKLTIDADLQSWLYESFKKDKSCSVSIKPFTGEVLALVSTPSYDNNTFITGMSEEQWKLLNEDDRKLL